MMMKGDRKGKWKTSDKSIFKPNKEWKVDRARERRAKAKQALREGKEPEKVKSDRRDWI